MKFRAWYADGTVYRGNSAEDWKALPAEGVVVVVEYEDTGRRIFSGGDWYYLDGGRLAYVPSREWGRDEPRPVACRDCIKRGVGVPDHVYWATLRAAKNGN